MNSTRFFRVCSLARQCQLKVIWWGVVFSMSASLFVTIANGQGTVYFRNKIDGQVGWVDAPFFNEAGIRLEGSNYAAQLYAWKTGDGLLPVGAPVPFRTHGYFFGEDELISFVYGCNPVWVQVRAWAVQGGTSFEQAAAGGGWTGVSGVLFLPQTGNPARPETGCEGRLIGLQYPGSPLLLQQPQDQSLLAGASATLSVLASSGVLMSYQWYQQPSDRPDGLIVGATNTTYTTSTLVTNTTFWVSVTNSAGSVLSDKAIIRVLPTAPRLTLEQVSGPPVLTLDGFPGITYRIEYSTKLSTANWTSLVELLLNRTPFTFSDSGGSNSAARFYRAVAQ